MHARLPSRVISHVRAICVSRVLLDGLQKKEGLLVVYLETSRKEKIFKKTKIYIQVLHCRVLSWIQR